MLAAGTVVTVIIDIYNSVLSYYRSRIQKKSVIETALFPDRKHRIMLLFLPWPERLEVISRLLVKTDLVTVEWTVPASTKIHPPVAVR